MLEPSLRDSIALSDYIEISNSFYHNLLGYKPIETSLQKVPESKWKKFTTKIGVNLDSQGVYLPRNQTAIIREKNPLSLFHEYFGHGLYCEQSLIGRKLVELEKKLLEEEKQEFQNRNFTLDNIKKFRKNNKTFQELSEFQEQNLVQYELFAIWTEYLLSEKQNLKENFGRKYDSLHNKDKELVDSLINFSKTYGNLATFYAFELRRIQDKKRLLRLCKDVYGNKLYRTRLILHFGSGKHFSDIDLFIVSSDIPSTYDPWLDVRAYKQQDITMGINVLNPMITDPIIAGKLVFGDEDYLESLKRKIISQQITEEAIKFNLKEYEIEKRRSKDKSLGGYLQDKNLRSAKIFLTNALALKNGNKILTSKGLVDYAKKRLSHSEKFIELKGGIE